MDRHRLDGHSGANLDTQCIEKYDGVHTVQRAGLPLVNVCKNTVCNGADIVCTDPHAVLFLQKGPDVAGAHASGVHGDDLIVETAEVTRVFGDKDRVKRTLTISGDIDWQTAEIGSQSLGGRAVALIDWQRFVLFVDPREGFPHPGFFFQMGVQFAAERGFDKATGNEFDEIMEALFAAVFTAGYELFNSSGKAGFGRCFGSLGSARRALLFRGHMCHSSMAAKGRHCTR